MRFDVYTSRVRRMPVKAINKPIIEYNFQDEQMFIRIK